MLKLSEVAVKLNCSVSNVYALVESNRLPVVPTGAGGKGYRVREADLEAFLEESRHGRRPQTWPERTKPVKLKHLRPS
jgi:excisionase family DNA binding protein